MKRPLYKKQEEHAHRLRIALSSHGAALDASSTGCGKTLVAADIAAETTRPTLVVCLKNSIPMWKAELKDRGANSIGVINYEMLRTGKTEWGDPVTGLHKGFKFTIPDDALIIWDECQKAQGVDTQNAKMLIAAKPYWNLLLSATAVENPTEMRALGFILNLHGLRNFWQWCRNRGCKPNQWKGLDFYDPSGAILNGLHHEIFPEHGSRLTVADLKEHFQETQIITTPLDFGPEIKKIYDEMETELALLSDVVKTDTKNPAAMRLVARLRARQRTELCKVPTIIEMAEDLMKEGRSVVVFVNFDATIEALLARFPTDSIIRGSQTQEERQLVMQNFQSDKRRFLICNVQAGGVSISLHDTHGKHPRTAIISPSDNAKDILQVLGRVHRAGGATPSQQHILFAAGTVEVAVEKNCRTKIQNMEIFNDGKTIDTLPQKSQDDIPVTEEPAQHAKFNPSSLGMFERCPGYRNRSGTNPQAEAGTRAHEALEKDEIPKLPEKERAAPQLCQDYIDALIVERGLPDKEYREVRFTIDLGGDIKTFGTCDRFMKYSNHGEMLDFKFGYMSVTDAETNAQAWAYVIGAFQRWPDLLTITFTFLVPNQDEITTHTFDCTDLPKMQLRLNTIIRRAMEVGENLGKFETLLNPQPGLCEFCSQQTQCPAIAARALKVAKGIAEGLPVPADLAVSADRPDDIQHLLRLAPLLENWAADIKATALKLNLQEGLEIPGFIRQERNTPRSITSVAGAWDTAKDLGVDIEDFLLTCTGISIVELESAVRAAAGTKRGAKGAASNKMEKELRARDLLKEQTKYHYLREERA